MPNEMSWIAADKKAGMTLEELEDVVKTFRQCHPGANGKVKVSTGFSQQIQRITLVEVSDVPKA